MPIYEYRCDACQSHVESLQQAGDPPPVCPDCGIPLVRQFSTFGIKMKLSWVSRMEGKYGRQGHPYQEEDGSPRAGVRTHELPAVPGPKTRRMWRHAHEASERARKEGTT